MLTQFSHDWITVQDFLIAFGYTYFPSH